MAWPRPTHPFIRPWGHKATSIVSLGSPFIRLNHFGVYSPDYLDRGAVWNLDICQGFPPACLLAPNNDSRATGPIVVMRRALPLPLRYGERDRYLNEWGDGCQACQ